MIETRVNTKTHCRYCGTKLTYDEKRKCQVCLTCHPLNAAKPETVKDKTKYLDVKLTESRVREIVRDELENWHIPKPPEVSERYKDITAPTMEDLQALPEESLTWRQQAKELGINSFGKKKAVVLAEIAEKIERPAEG